MPRLTADELRAVGFLDEEIDEYLSSDLIDAGFTPQEIADEFGLATLDGEAPIPAAEPVQPEQPGEMFSGHIPSTPIPEGGAISTLDVPPPTGYATPESEAARSVVRGMFDGTLPEGLGYLQAPIEAGETRKLLNEYFGPIGLTVKEEKALQAKAPNLMAIRHALTAIPLPGITNKLSSPMEIEDFLSQTPDEQGNEVLALAADYILFGVGGKAAKTAFSLAMKRFPGFAAWATKARLNPLGDWYRRATIKERGLAVRSAARAKTAGMSDAEISNSLNKFYGEKFKRTPKIEPPPRPGEPKPFTPTAEDLKAPTAKQRASGEFAPARTVTEVVEDAGKATGGQRGAVGSEPPSKNVVPPERALQKPTAEFIGMQEDRLQGDFPLFNIKGGPRNNSTVSIDTLNELGIEVPDYPGKTKAPVEKKASEKLYHGTYPGLADKGFRPREEIPGEFVDPATNPLGTYLTDSPEQAKTFGQKVVEVELPDKTLDLTGAKTFEDHIEALPIDAEKNSLELRNMKADSHWAGEIEMQYKLIEDLDTKFGIVDKLKEEGYDSLKFPEEHRGVKGITTVIFDHKKVRTIKPLTPKEEIDDARKRLASGKLDPASDEFKALEKVHGKKIQLGSVRHLPKARFPIGEKTVYADSAAKPKRGDVKTVRKDGTEVWHDKSGRLIIKGVILSPVKKIRHKQIADIYKKNAYAQKWFQDWADFAKTLRDKGYSGVEFNKRLRVMAMLSAGQSPSGNMDKYSKAITAIEHGQEIKGGPGTGYTAIDAKKIMAIMDGRVAPQTLEEMKASYGKKVGSFMATALDPKHPKATTVDRWIVRAYGFEPTLSPLPDWMYNFIEKDINEVAKQLGVPPSEVQPPLWVETRGTKGGTETYELAAQAKPSKRLSGEEFKSTKAERVTALHVSMAEIVASRGEKLDPSLNTIVRKNQQATLNAGTPAFPSSANQTKKSKTDGSFIFTQGPGVEVEAALSHFPERYSVTAEDIYDASKDPLGFRKRAGEIWSAEKAAGRDINVDGWPIRGGDSEQAAVDNIFRILLKETGDYKGFTMDMNRGLWVGLFPPVEIASPTVKTTLGASGTVEAVAPAPQDPVVLRKEIPALHRDLTAEAKSIAARYPGAEVSFDQGTMSRFGEMTSGKLEPGSAITIKGPLEMARAIAAELGLSRHQNFVFAIHTYGSEGKYPPNGMFAEWRLDPKLKEADVIEMAKAFGLTDVNMAYGKQGGLYIKQFVGNWESKETLANFNRFKIKSRAEGANSFSYPAHSEPWNLFEAPSWRDLGDPEYEYQRALADYWGRTKGKEVYDAARKRGKKYYQSQFQKGLPLGHGGGPPPGGPTQKSTAGVPVAGPARKSKPVATFSAAPGKGNVWIKQAKGPGSASNKNRVLFVQISNKLQIWDTPDDVGAPYFDKLYSKRQGYLRPDDFWELPEWIAQGAKTFKNADVYVVRDLAEARTFIKDAGYDKVMFSVMSDQQSMVEDIILGYKGEVILGGYVPPESFAGRKNVKFLDSIKAAAKEMGVPYVEGADYRHFKGTKTMPRLNMSEGCRHCCKFCTIPKEVVASSPENVASQIEAFKDLDFELVYLNDKTFGQAENFSELPRIKDEILAFNPKFKGFVIQTTGPAFNKFSDEFLRESGIKFVELGVESYNDEILKKVLKPAREKSIQQAVDKMREHDIQFIPNLLVGLAGKDKSGAVWSETAETYKHTLDFLKKNADIISHVNINNLALYEGTDITAELGNKVKTDLNQNATERSWHEDPQVHSDFYRDATEFGSKMLDKDVVLGAPVDKFSAAGGNKVVDADGKPSVAYHGTQSVFDKFEKRKAHDKEGKSLGLGWGRGVFSFASKPGEAGKYAFAKDRGPGYTAGAPSIMPVHLSIRNPFYVDYHAVGVEKASNYTRYQSARDGYKDTRTDIYWGDYPASRNQRLEALVKQLKKEGYDGIIEGNKKDGYEYAVFNPDQIRSVYEIPKGPGSRAVALLKSQKGMVDFQFRNKEIEKRYKASQGAQAPSLTDKTMDVLIGLKNKASREFEHLPKTKEFAQLSFDLRKLAKQKGVASDKVLRALHAISADLNPDSYNLFARYVLLDDLIETAMRGEGLPLGFRKKTLHEEVQYLNAAVKKDPSVIAAVKKRNKVWADIKTTYISVMQDIGFDVSERFSRKAYFRHQVLEHVRTQGLFGAGRKLKTPSARGFLKKRGGSELDINTDYIQAEHEVMAQMVYDIEVAKTIKAVDDNYNIIDRLRKEAKAANKANAGKNIEPVKWEDLIPAGYRLWQPREGTTFYMVDSIPAKLAEQLRDGVFDEIGLSVNDLKRVMAIGGARKSFVLKEEVADTLDELVKVRTENPVIAGRRHMIRTWKVLMLVAPRRWAKYNTRNMTGDADAAFVGNPSGFKKVPGAVRELLDVYFRQKPMSKNMQDWFERGGMETTLQAAEMGDLNELKLFVNLTKKKTKLARIPTKAWQGYWKAARLTTDFREAIMRYSNYLSYLEQMEASPSGLPKEFGASDPEEVKGLKDIKDRAFLLSNDLLGAYDRVSVMGQALRENVIPFWSWNEVNFKRYIQFARNAANDGRLAQKIGRKAIGTVGRSPFIAYRVGKFMLKATALWSMLQVWNHTMFPEEEEGLPERVRVRPHIILSKNEDGTVNFFSRLGTLGDFLEWFGLDAAPEYVDKLYSGEMGIKEVAKEMALSPARKVISGSAPILKLAGELLTRRALFPDPFEPRVIRDKMEHFARALTIENEYKEIAGKPTQGYTESLKRSLVYVSDPGQAAYGDIYIKKRRFMKELGKYGEGFWLTPRGDKLYNFKLALRYKDTKAAGKYAREYSQLYLESGGDPERVAYNIKDSIKRMAPLSGMAEDEQLAFIASLDEDDRKRLIRAQQFYLETIAGGF